MPRKIIRADYKFKNFIENIIDKSLSDKETLREKYHMYGYLFYYLIYDVVKI